MTGRTEVKIWLRIGLHWSNKVVHVLRSGGLDHKQHDMSETRETANAAMSQALARLAGDIAAGRAEDSSYSTKILHSMQNFCGIAKTVPRCRRRIRLPPRQAFGLNAHRVMRVNERKPRKHAVNVKIFRFLTNSTQNSIISAN
jgi:hypothetical protein